MRGESKILNWREYVPEATQFCGEKFEELLEDWGLEELSADDTFSRICNRYCGYLKTIHLKRQEYFTSLWTLDGLANQFSGIGVKWMVPLMKARLSEESKSAMTEAAAKDLIGWACRRYNHWLGRQLYG